jgi:hypothetical protein
VVPLATLSWRVLAELCVLFIDHDSDMRCDKKELITGRRRRWYAAAFTASKKVSITDSHKVLIPQLLLR